MASEQAKLLAKQILDALEQGLPIGTDQALQLRYWAGTEVAALPLADIARRILGLEKDSSA